MRDGEGAIVGCGNTGLDPTVSSCEALREESPGKGPPPRPIARADGPCERELHGAKAPEEAKMNEAESHRQAHDEPRREPLLLPVNEAGRDFLLGDLHGEVGKLEDALAQVAFDPLRDRVISVGDLVDRGRASRAALALVARPWFFAVRGNHEEMMRAALAAGPQSDAWRLWMMNSGRWIADVPREEWSALAATVAALPIAITLERPDGLPVGIVHAEYPGDDWAALDRLLKRPALVERMLWGRGVLRAGRARHTRGVALTVHGHTPVPRPVRLGNALFIDTGAVYGGSLTLVDADEALAWPDGAMDR